MIEREDVQTHLKQQVGYFNRDKSRPLRYGVFLISRPVSQDQSLWPFIEQTMNALLAPALGMVNELFEGSEDLEEIPFGLNMQEYLNYATMQFSKRFQRIQRAREQTLEQVYQTDEEM